MQKIMFNDRYGLTQAVIEGRKTLTRRIEGGARFQEMAASAGEIFYNNDEGTLDMWYEGIDIFRHKTRYKVGEVVAVAQSYEDVFYKYRFGLPIDDDPQCNGGGFKNKMLVKAEYMPYQIRITNIRCEWLQDISDEDCIREGIKKVKYCDASGVWRSYYFHFGVTPTNCAGGQYKEYPTPREAFAALIDKVSGRGTWERDPWVVVYEFKLVK